MKASRLYLKLITGIIILNTSFLNAQKLPNIQKKSIFAFQNIKIDGVANEWVDGFQAYNKAVDAFYTLANDDQNIYLVMKVVYKDVIDKILRGGITFTINPGLNKKDKNGISISYPTIEGPDMWLVTNKFLSTINMYSEGKAINVNELFYTKEKTITVTGVEAIPDQSVSLYNNEGIKAASLFDDKMIFTYELRIPIAYLKLSDGNKVFSYHVKINEAPAVKRPSVITSSTPPPPPPIPISTVASTDFWGEYMLAKKQ